ncbi:hypothetical protein DAETH_44310 (plasmid) [Deinococcus aetherius]|uniref:Uncharacterized protein n=1 Tax=Deinococcus aetherius TaxID=200252 RepID=A0ABM8AKV8_9DEIO|nr:hypothetical protein [Deinococcus aetherius]BDP44462.1 hypothetical protein DAETH_44310 [Deinococcus aetherius]
MKTLPLLPATLALAALSGAFAARSPSNLEPFGKEQVCVGRAEVLLRGQPDKALTKVAQDRLDRLGASLGLGKAGQNYTSCPAWLSFRAEAGNDGNGKLVYHATLSLVTPKVQTKAIENLRSEAFDYDGGFEYVSLWDRTHASIAFDVENLSFRVGAEVVSQMDDFGTDWKKTH